MEPRALSYIAAACGGRLLHGAPEAVVQRVCTDSRQAQAGDLFVALAGDKFDGHDFLAPVAEKGATAALIEEGKAAAALGKLPSPAPLAVIIAHHSREALGRLAARYRHEFRLPMVAVAGSNGKTTTKELLAAVLRQQFHTLWSEASFNNDIGVPLTLLKLERSHRAAVLELGTNHPGELAPLVRLCRPHFGLITNIGREHLEFFRDLAGVAQEEGWLAELLPANGKLFISGDSEWTETIAARARAEVIRLGLGRNNPWRAHNLRTDARGTAFEVVAPRADFCGEFRVSLLGRHQVSNALFALAVGAEMGVIADDARRGLESCPPAKMRMQVWQTGGATVLDDAYNANADSMLAALATLLDFPAQGRRIAVLGDMAELGEFTLPAHVEVGRQAASLGVDYLMAVGRWAKSTADAARTAGLNEVSEFATPADAAEALKKIMQPGDVVLLKASRASRFESVAEVLRGGK